MSPQLHTCPFCHTASAIENWYPDLAPEGTASYYCKSPDCEARTYYVWPDGTAQAEWPAELAA